MPAVRVSPELLRRVAPAAALGAVGTGLVVALGSVGAAVVFARRVVTPEAHRRLDTDLLAVDADGEHPTVTLRTTVPTLAPGRYGLQGPDQDWHLRLGEVVDTDQKKRTVTRELLQVDWGVPRPGPCTWDGYYYAGDPTSGLGLEHEEVLISSDVGELPAWRIDPPDGASSRWAVLVHGRSANRAETLRAVPAMLDAGCTVLVPSYRNDPDAPRSIDGVYNLGLSEWRDVEAALDHAREHGAREIVLVGWSMGGAIVMQTLDRSERVDAVCQVILDGPVLDWVDVLVHQADLNKVPAGIGEMAQRMMAHRSARLVVGVAEPLDLAITDWVARAAEIEVPVLIIHSVADDVVPYGPSQALADKRPDLVRWERWDHALHCKEWNVDSRRWEDLVRDAAAGHAPTSPPGRASMRDGEEEGEAGEAGEEGQAGEAGEEGQAGVRRH